MLIGEYSVPQKKFSNLKECFSKWKTEEFSQKPDRVKSDEINRQLLELILQEPDPAFLLTAVLDYVEQIDKEDILHHYTLNSFELWLNQYSDLSEEKNLYVRGKITGKWLPREEYQRFFPIGMGKRYEGSHFVTAHKSPDLDTTIASFWGWMDAFSARVSTALHLWNVPGGPSSSQIEIDILFHQVFGNAVFSHLAKTRSILSLTGNDLMTQIDLIRKKPEDKIVSGLHEKAGRAIVITDDKGYYLGDWRSMDVEGVRLIIMLLSNCLRWFENQIHIRLFSLFSKKSVTTKDLKEFIQTNFSVTLEDCEPAKEYSERDKSHLDSFLKQVLNVPDGLKATFEEFGKSLTELLSIDFAKVKNLVSAIENENLFDENGTLTDDRTLLFSYLEKTIRALHTAIQNLRAHIETFDIAMKIKTEVFQEMEKFVSVRADVEEIRSKMNNYQYLTVTYPDRNRFYPVGIIPSSAVRKQILGTVSLRDFSNREEMSIPSYLEVISVIDHHKTSLLTTQPPMVIIKDAQSSNAIVADISMEINERYSTHGLKKEEISKGLQELEDQPHLYSKMKKKEAIAHRNDRFYVHREREITEYLHFLYGILDDTDLLTKVSDIDVECVEELLNRLKSLVERKEVEIISLADIPRGERFAKDAAKRILQLDDMYSLYKKVYDHREKEVEKNIKLLLDEKPSSFFDDTKEQNGCCRIGQTKLFAKNFPYLQKHQSKIRSIWVERSSSRNKENPELDLFIHMISTIVSAEEVYKGKESSYDHKDQIWIWVPDGDLALEHLKRFLTAFQGSPYIENIDLSVEFTGSETEILEEIFAETFPELPVEEKKEKKGPPIAVLHYNAGKLNSRKSHLSPFLPKLMN